MAIEWSPWYQFPSKPSHKRLVEPASNSANESFLSHTTVSSDEHGLGHFFRLPREIRDIVWSECLPKSFGKLPVVQGTDSQNTQLALPRTSSRLYFEVSSQLYPTASNPFIIPVTPEYKYGEWFTLSNGKKNATIWKFSSRREAITRGFLHIGRQPTTFRVVIEAPDRDDACQIILLFWKVLDLVDIFAESVKRPHGIEIELKDGEKGKWFAGGMATTTNIDGKPTSPDYQCMLFPFLQLRNISHSEVKVPNGVKLEPYDLRPMRKVERRMKQSFGVNDESTLWSDSPTDPRIEYHLSRCEKAIFRLKGWTVMMVRVERFVDSCLESHWVSEDMEERMKHVLKHGQVQGKQRYLLWTIQDDAELRRLWTTNMNPLRTRMTMYANSVRRLRDIERRLRDVERREALEMGRVLF